MSHLVGDLDEQAEAFGGLEQKPVGDVLTEVLGLGARLHFESLRYKAMLFSSGFCL